MARNESGTLVTYLHPKTIVHLDYGSELGRMHGVAWSMTGKAQDATGFEQFASGETFSSVLAAKLAICHAQDDAAGRPRGSCVTVAVGEPVTRRVDMNPHGLM